MALKSETITKPRSRKALNGSKALVLVLIISIIDQFEFVSDFVRRISNFFSAEGRLRIVFLSTVNQDHIGPGSAVTHLAWFAVFFAIKPILRPLH